MIFILRQIGVGLIASLAFCGVASSQVTVSKAWVRGTVAGQKASGAFMEITSSESISLVGVASPAAGLSEIHEMARDGDVMKMRAVRRLDVPAGRAVELKPGGYHIMMMELSRPLKKGDSVPLTLTFERRDGKKLTVELKAEVRDLTAPAKDSAHRH